MAELFYSSIFGELTKNVQARIDAMSELNKRLFDTVIFENYLDWDTPSIGLDFEELIGQYNITIAAPTIGEDAKESIIGTEGLETVQARILRHALTQPMTIQQYRKVMQILDSKSITGSVRTEQLVNLMMGNVKTVVDGINAKLDVMFLEALSNEGKITLGASNNPEGGVRGLVDYNQPDDNIATAKTAWTADNISTVDVFEDIQAVVDAASDKVVFSEILCAPSVISYVCKSSQLKKVIFGNDKQNSPLLLQQLNEFMQMNNLPVFKAIRRSVRMQNNGVVSPYSPWNAKNIVFVPAGKLGTIKNAYANSELKQEPGVAYSNYGRIRVSQWGVGETQGSNGVEFTKAECFALPVITEMNGIYTLKTQN